jgi:ABC-2 type transport system permease protein
MKRAFAVATAEFLALVRTKFFIVGVLLVPIMISASIMFTNYADKNLGAEVHKIAVLDRTGVLFPAIERETTTSAPVPGAPINPENDDPDATRPANVQVVQVSLQGKSADEVKLDLSKQVKDKTLYGFVDIPATLLDSAPGDSLSIDYYTENLSNRVVPRWLGKAINSEVTRRRFEAAHVDRDLTDRLSRTTKITTRGLLVRATDGSVQPAREVRSWETFAIPFGLMYLLFLAVVMTAPHMMNAVIEEKMSRISEVLLASVTPTELLGGKIMGIAAVSVLLALVYLGGGLYAAFATGQWQLVDFSLLIWFLVFLLCAVLMFGSVFLSIGAACSDLKDAQSMVQPSMFFMIIPMFLAPLVLGAPGSTQATILSLIPLWSPFLMLIRLAMTPPPPLWQVLLSVVLTGGTAAFFVWCAGRIFRIGLLMTGKAPNIPELMKWIRA